LYRDLSFEGAQREGKRFEIYIAGLEFELGRASRVRVWDSRSFTHSPGLTKCAFRGWGFLESKKKKRLRDLNVT
jgi:hypothetical protein